MAEECSDCATRREVVGYLMADRKRAEVENGRLRRDKSSLEADIREDRELRQLMVLQPEAVDALVAAVRGVVSNHRGFDAQAQCWIRCECSLCVALSPFPGEAK